ncbi:MAG: DUF4230 domain-containing protein [Candidatus Eisenbacteria sp.]|nr:DUF4230 domain-containing protein [Candidatus Eisenbacteria bacterium]
MSDLFGVLLLILLLVVAIIVGVVVITRQFRRRPASQVSIHSNIQQMRAIGQLSVFKVITKEIVTETDHSWGDFGRRYLSWVLSQRKMAMIFEFGIDFRYDLRRPEFEIIEEGRDRFSIQMPPCHHEAHIRDIRFYDEQQSRFLPWLLPDLLRGFLAGGFSEENRNRLVAAAKSHAEEQARQLIGNLESEVENSAKATLESISRAFGAEEVRFVFQKGGGLDLDIGYLKREAS